MGASINVTWIPLHRGAVAFFGLLQLALLEIDVAKLGVMMGLVEVMNLSLKLFDATAIEGARQLESARGRIAINIEIIECRTQTRADKNEESPDPFATPDGINQHPQL